MGCCRCIKRLEHVEKVIETYDPNETFLSYDLLTVWVNKKTKKAFILVSKENGIATWVPINADITTIDKIILNCGEVEANENNEIEHKGECGARTVTDDCTDLCITIETDWGLKGGGTVCAGESLKLSIDLANTNLVISNVKDVQDGDLVAFDGTSGKVIKKADNLRLGDAENSWNGKINPDTKALEFFPNALSTTPILSMLPNGVMLMPWQPKVAAVFNGEANIGQANVDVDIGGFGGVAFTKILDQDGYNLSASNFYPGDGASQGAYYTTTYDNAFYLVIVQFLITKPNQQDTATVNISIKYPGIEPYRYRKELLAGAPFETFTGMTVIKGVKGNKINFSVATTNNTLKITNLGGASRESYIGIYMLG